MLNLYTIFHLNLAYSSIEEAQQPAVIRRCYWPLLRLARHLNLPFGIEASGYTLERIQSIDPRWIDELRSLVTIGPCEFVGSGYAQIIGPLVPAEVNAANLRLGHRVYKELLGVRPRLALVNEQAYSAGVLQHYVDSGYRAIVMEWDNAARVHPEWSCNWRYYPQIAVGQHGEEIALIWNYSIAFQKFQRYAHAEMDINQYVDYLDTHRAADLRFFPLYGNDVEIFDFRPNRYHTEPKPAAENEWRRIERLLEKLMEQDWLEFVTPSSVLKGIDLSGAGQRLSLETPEQPIPVKKQGKYNITRWAVTGKNDLAINTACWRIYNMLRQKSAVRDEEWRYLCYLWSSDFRTHITPERWRKYCSSLETAERDRVFSSREATGCSSVSARQSRKSWASDDRFTVIETDLLKLRLNNRKGLAIDRL
ncbi:MAG: glycoside hydrolase family 57 [bacterium]